MYKTGYREFNYVALSVAPNSIDVDISVHKEYSFNSDNRKESNREVG